ncbi:recombinase family protein [Nocardia niigatensis]|uniref:Recombinase domain-containing protein n=1 Tax=Nocardia nova TaxID=37330 RepID=A0A2S5ZWC1_9NOCA|nr:hypothetical protein [Nocardia nova]PPJ02682.1 hypothetical protein C5E44_35155 [Nocardia nova]PPJ21907.1 hypothetical protein C5F51_32335 [Nocardia nova]
MISANIRTARSRSSCGYFFELDTTPSFTEVEVSRHSGAVHNLDLTTNAAPVPVDPNAAVGRWTWSNVAGVLSNPKYTGHQVWNRRGRKSNKNQANPISEWVWSEKPVHEPLVDLDLFVAVQERGKTRDNSRRGAGANSHPQTKRSYRFRSHLYCDLCNRRMFGKTRRVAAYYVCAAKKGYIPEGHPTGGSFFVREDDISEHLNTFLNQHVFGDYRRALLTNANLHTHAETEHTQRITALRHGITDTETKIKRLVRSLELVDEPDQDLIRDISERRAQLRDHLADLQAQLADAETQQQQQPNPTLIDALPTGEIRIDQLPEHIARDVYQALQLEIRYNKTANRVRYRITLTGATLNHAHRTTSTAMALQPRTDQIGGTCQTKQPPPGTAPGKSVPMFTVPPAGHCEHGNGPDL